MPDIDGGQAGLLQPKPPITSSPGSMRSARSMDILECLVPRGCARGHSAKNPTNAGQGVGLDCPTRRNATAAQARTTTNAPEALRDLAEESAAQAKENLETVRAAAGEATNLMAVGQESDEDMRLDAMLELMVDRA